LQIVEVLALLVLRNILLLLEIYYVMNNVHFELKYKTAGQQM